MATEVHHDQDDDQTLQAFEEIDTILAQAKRELLHRDRCRERKLRRNMNLSDIPENFAHVPASACTSTLSPSEAPNYTSQPDFASSVDGSGAQRHKPHQKLQILSVSAPMKWLRGYMGCVMAVQDASKNAGCSAMLTGSVDYVFPPKAHPSRQRVGFGL